MTLGIPVSRALHVCILCIGLCIGIFVPRCETASGAAKTGSLAMAANMVKNAWAKFKGFFGERVEEMPKYTFPDTLDEFGYHFNEKGELVNREGGGFQFVVREGDRNYNQQHYDALGELVTEYLYNMMEKELQLEKVYIPQTDARREEPQSFIFRSKDAAVSDKLMVLIHGSGAVRAGQWSRKLIINENIDTGSQLPYIRRAVEDGYGVIVLNPNLNEVTVNGRSVKIRGSESPEEHGMYVWQNFVLPAQAQHIVIVAHSYGGIVTCNIAQKFLEDFKKRVFSVVFTDSVHTADRNRWSQAVKDFMKERAVNFASAYVPLNVMLDASSPDDCLSVSAGTPEHERTSHACIDIAFKFIRDNFSTWTKDGSMAPRDFLPLPENLDDYSPAKKWEKRQQEEEEAKKKEQEEKKEGEGEILSKKEEDSPSKKEEDSPSKKAEDSPSKKDGGQGSENDQPETQKDCKEEEKGGDVKKAQDEADKEQPTESAEEKGNAAGEQGQESAAAVEGKESVGGEQSPSAAGEPGEKSAADGQSKQTTDDGEKKEDEKKPKPPTPEEPPKSEL